MDRARRRPSAIPARQQERGNVFELIPEAAATAPHDMADLIDLRTKITERANQVLEAHARAASLDKSEIVRKVLDAWADEEIHRATLIARMTRCEGGGAA